MLDRLQFDLFTQWYRRNRPGFATFFSNNVAHLQHAYCRQMEPGAFKVQPSAEQVRLYGDAIRGGYVAINAVVGCAVRLDDGRPVFGCTDGAGKAPSPYFGCQISDRVDPTAQLIGLAGNGAIRFDALFYAIDGSKSGCHHPDGSLWIETGRHRAHAAPCSILDILPTQLDLLGLQMPAGRVPGRSVVGSLHDNSAIGPAIGSIARAA